MFFDQSPGQGGGEQRITGRLARWIHLISRQADPAVAGRR